MILGYPQETSIASVSLSKTNNPILPSSEKPHLSHLDMRNHSSWERSVGFFQRDNFREHVLLHNVLWHWKDTRNNAILLLGHEVIDVRAHRAAKPKKHISTLVHVGSTTYPITSNFGGNGWKWGKPNATNLQLLMVYAYAFLVSWEVNGDRFWHLIYHVPPTFWSHETIACHPCNIQFWRLGAMSPRTTQGVK